MRRSINILVTEVDIETMRRVLTMGDEEKEQEQEQEQGQEQEEEKEKENN